MTNAFVKGLKHETNYTTTENGGTAYKSTDSSLLDLFAVAGSLRSRQESEIETMFIKAFSEDKLLATKLMFFTRNCRGGLGEKRTYKIILKFMANHYPEIVKKNFKPMVEFGRFDDFMTLMGTKVENDMIEFIRNQLSEDFSGMLAGKPISLASKWLPSVNTSSKETRKLAKLVAKKLGATEKEYRKMLSKLRKHIQVIEVKMSAREWTDIDYKAVPSQAMRIYKDAFNRHDSAGFGKFMTKVEKGEVEIKATTLYPYEILRSMGLQGAWSGTFSVKQDRVLEAQWKALPNYIEGEHNVLVMADTSGSMTSNNGMPIQSSIGLAMYFAERNSGPFKDTFLTFSSLPSLVTLKGNSVYEKVKCIPSIVQNTNIEKAFDLVLQTAINHNLSQEEMVEAIVVISDGEYDAMTTDRGQGSFYDGMAKRFAKHGYTMPNVVFWNVASRESNKVQVHSKQKNVQLVSGQSVSAFKSVIECINMTPYEAMVKTLTNPMYDIVTI